MRKSFRKFKIIFLLIPIIVGSGLFFMKRGEKNDLNLVEVKRGDIISRVSVTGKTKAMKNVNLAFEKGGKIKGVYAQIGDKVKEGYILAELDRGELTAQLNEAEANSEVQQAKLDELRRGTRPEELKIAETKLTNAQSSLDDARNNLMDKLHDSYTKADDAVRNKTDQFFSNPRSLFPQINFYVTDAQLKSDLEKKRVDLESLFSSWKSSLEGLGSESDLNAYLASTKYNLNQVKNFLEKAALALNSLTSTSNLTQASIDSYRSDVSAARINVNSATAGLSSAEEKLKNAEANVSLYENEYELKLAGSSYEEISAQEGQIKQAEAKIQLTKAQIDRTYLRSPLNGIVVKQNAKTGEIVAANTQIVSIISEGNFKIEVNVPEMDVGRIAIGNKVSITLDAFPGEIFSGKIFYIDPAETIIDGVVNFRTEVLFDDSSDSLKNGLTANLDIETVRKNNVLILPQSAVMEKDGGVFVEKIIEDKTEGVRITTGIRDQDGNVEILSGLIEGDRVVNIGFKRPE